ncbi:LysR substrate-binding domain-containing protein [Nonomuraea wenchangensis]
MHQDEVPKELLSETHPLAGRDELTVPDLDRIPLLRPHSADPTSIAWSVVDPRPDGRRATTGPSARNLEEALTMVAAGLGGYLVPRDVAGAVRHPLVLAQPVSDLSASPFSVAEMTNAP